MQTLPDKDYKYILTYVNHFTKFCVLTPVKSKRAEEVAEVLLPIFLMFGAPVILQSDNGREFVNAVISELSTLWPDLQLVTGRPRHPQSQGAVERLNGVIQDKLRIWMSENKSTRWKKNYATMRCSCVKKNMKCNSRCHPGTSCGNVE